MASRNLSSYFAQLSGLGFLISWGVMSYHGGTISLLKTAWTRTFPDGSPLIASETGISFIDFPLNTVVAFFASASNWDHADTGSGPWLMLLDLTAIMPVINMMVLVESKRASRFWMQSSILWQLLWNCVAVAVCLPLWARSYVQHRAEPRQHRLGYYEAQSLPFTALVHLALQAAATLPAWLGAAPATTQNGVLLYLSGAFLFRWFQALCSGLLARICSGIGPFLKPVKSAYYVTGAVSALIHVGIILYSIFSSESGLSPLRVYVPNHRDHTGQPYILIEEVHRFLQYDYIIVIIVVFILGTHILRSDSKAGSNIQGKSKCPTGSNSTLFILTAVLGPGAGMAYAISCDEEDRLLSNGASK